MQPKKLEIATVGGGCFWCTEAVFQGVKGVERVVSGYTGGYVPGRPTYREVCSGLTGHAEVVQITFDSNVISYRDILVLFMTTHDPIALNRKPGEVGSQYRSVIFYHNGEQQKIAAVVRSEMEGYYNAPIATELSSLGIFYKAEGYHQDYYRNNSSEGYCTAVIKPKLAELQKMHAAKLS